jgi:hypothetical protein
VSVENVIRAIAGYAGERIALKRDGHPAFGYPFTEQIRFTIAPPGPAPLKTTLFSLVDVPDLRVLAELWPEAKTIWFGAGPSPIILHRALIAFAWLRRFRLIPSLYPFSRLIHFAANRLVWGEHRGGMFVAVNGLTGTGEAMARSWHLIAEGDDGPFIPAWRAPRSSAGCSRAVRRPPAHASRRTISSSMITSRCSRPGASSQASGRNSQARSDCSRARRVRHRDGSSARISLNCPPRP